MKNHIYWEQLRIPPLATIWWTFAALALISGEAFGVIMVGVFLGMFLVGEPFGVIQYARGKPGITFTEFVRKFYSDKPYRRFLVTGYVWYLGASLFSAGLGLRMEFDPYEHWSFRTIRLLLLFSGIGTWLKPHFLGDGSKG